MMGNVRVCALHIEKHGMFKSLVTEKSFSRIASPPSHVFSFFLFFSLYICVFLVSFQLLLPFCLLGLKINSIGAKGNRKGVGPGIR